MSKITLELGGKYSAGEMFKRAQNDVKAFGRSTKDASGIGVGALREITNHVDGPLKTSLGTLQGVLTGMAAGGIFGMVRAVGVGAFQLITQAVQETQERIKACIDFINTNVLTSMQGISTGAATLVEDAKKASEEIKAFIGEANTSIATNARVEVANLHIQTLQKITDDMSEGSRKVLEADEAYHAAMINANAKVAQYSKQLEVYSSTKAELENKETELQGKILDAEAAVEKYQKEHADQLSKQKELMYKANMSIQEWMATGMTVEQAQKAHVGCQNQLNKYIEEHTDYVKTAAQLQDNLNKMNEQRKQVGDMIANIDTQSVAAETQLNAAKIERTAKEREMSVKLNDAKLALEKETNATTEAASQEMQKTEKEKFRMEIEDKINKLKDATDKERNTLQKQLNEYLQKDLAHQEIRDKLQEDWEKLQKEENEKKKKQNEKKDKDKDNVKGKITVTLGHGQAADIGEEVEEKEDFKDWMKKVRQEQRKARDTKNNMKIDQAKMAKALKGEMPKAEADAWMQYAKSKYTPDQMRELGKLAMNKELLSKSDQEKQKKAIEQMAKEIGKSLQAK